MDHVFHRHRFASETEFADGEAEGAAVVGFGVEFGGDEVAGVQCDVLRACRQGEAELAVPDEDGRDDFVVGADKYLVFGGGVAEMSESGGEFFANGRE